LGPSAGSLVNFHRGFGEFFLGLLLNNLRMKKKTYKKEMVKLTNAYNKLSLKHFNTLKKVDKYKEKMRDISSKMDELKKDYKK
jgi:hypothetical protein